jgi:hypothetical protein
MVPTGVFTPKFLDLAIESLHGLPLGRPASQTLGEAASTGRGFPFLCVSVPRIRIRIQRVSAWGVVRFTFGLSHSEPRFECVSKSERHPRV